MNKDQGGRPTDDNKDQGKARPQENNPENQEVAEKFTNEEGNPADNVREMNPNRNVDKDDATNAGGYKN